ncbi:Smr/MutS family protein [Deltaproteobacteria bacterium OttesenSCG-928-K17]|nr:Smr/MutS family protein [Deltaproteobacteria bacterium OttesenSCG-928-K17]
MKNTLSILEYNEALQRLAQETHSEAGRLAALALTPELTVEDILESWALISEGREVLNLGDSLDLAAHIDLTEVLEPLKVEGSMLGVDELRAVGFEARCARAAKTFFAAAEEAAPGLAALAVGLTSLPDLIDGIERTIGPDGEILDSASTELARLRLEQASTRQGITSRLTNLMQDNSFRHLVRDELITTRSDRFVVPVRAGAAGAGRGLVHDWSKTGATAFLEPLEVVEDNNKLGLLKRKEKAEIERILRRLSNDCRAAAAELIISGGILTRLDLILAQARLARIWSALAPDYRPGGGVYLRQARHPLLMRRLQEKGGRMTPLDLNINSENPVMVISGLNTGGKTVAMKTLGLNLLLAKAGLHLPVGEGSFIDFPEKIIAVMGDEQDLSSDLSTFSGHVKSLNRVLSLARPGVLVLLDEIGSGTDPAEGAALGLAVLEELRGSGALVMGATHYQLIKTWAALTDGVVSVAVNASDSGQPLYGLTYGSPGFSGGLKMARRLGLPEELVSRAESYLDDGQRRAMELLAKLDDERGRLALEREGLEEQRLALARAEAALREQTRREADEWERKARVQNQAVTEALARNRREFEDLKQEMRKALAGKDTAGQISLSERKARLDQSLRDVRPQAVSTEKPLTEIRAGDQVMVGRLGRKALVLSVNTEKGEALVEAGGLNVKAPLTDLFPPPQESGRKQQTVSVTISPARRDNASLELNLLGHNVEDALDAINKELDRAVLDHRQKVYIVHGFGTGRLRQGIRQFLKNHPRVKNFERAPQNAGGDGVTVVTIE